MPYIKRLKLGRFPSFDGPRAYEMIEVDEMGNPVLKTSDRELKKVSNEISLTEKKIAPGVRAPDTRKGYSKPFDYHLWNKLRSQGKLKGQKGGN